MAAIISFSVNKDKLNQLDFNDKGWANVTLIMNDETDAYGQNCSVIKGQTQEEREAKAARIYLGNGKVVWNNGQVANAEKVEKQVTAAQQSTAGRETPDLPF